MGFDFGTTNSEVAVALEAMQAIIAGTETVVTGEYLCLAVLEAGAVNSPPGGPTRACGEKL